MEAVSNEYQFNFSDICKVWMLLPDARRICSSAERMIRYPLSATSAILQEENLIVLDNDQESIFPTDRFKAIIYYYYEDRDNKNDILRFVNELEG